MPSGDGGERARTEEKREAVGRVGRESRGVVRVGERVGGKEGTQEEAVEDRPPPKDRQPAAVFGGGQWKTRALLMKTDRAPRLPPTRTTSVGQVGHRRSAMSAASPPVFPNLFYSPLPLPCRVSRVKLGRAGLRGDK